MLMDQITSLLRRRKIRPFGELDLPVGRRLGITATHVQWVGLKKEHDGARAYMGPPSVQWNFSIRIEPRILYRDWRREWGIDSSDKIIQHIDQIFRGVHLSLFGTSVFPRVPARAVATASAHLQVCAYTSQVSSSQLETTNSTLSKAFNTSLNSDSIRRSVPIASLEFHSPRKHSLVNMFPQVM